MFAILRLLKYSRVLNTVRIADELLHERIIASLTNIKDPRRNERKKWRGKRKRENWNQFIITITETKINAPSLVVVIIVMSVRLSWLMSAFERTLIITVIIDWQAYHHYHRSHPGDNIPFPTPFHGSAKRKCGFYPQHYGNRVNCRCNHNFVCLA